MGELLSRLRQINVTSRSPGESVEVRLAPDGGLVARIGRAGVGDHTEVSFAAELRAAVAGALKGYGRATRRVMTDVNGPADPSRRGRDPGETDLTGRFAALRATGASPQNLVIVTRTGGGTVSVRICPGTLRRLRDDQLETHINAALAAASRQLRDDLARVLTTGARAADQGAGE